MRVGGKFESEALLFCHDSTTLSRKVRINSASSSFDADAVNLSGLRAASPVPRGPAGTLIRAAVPRRSSRAFLPSVRPVPLPGDRRRSGGAL
ncbi:hypothetical protein AAFF_G00056650 [Aldrovandia affinis]|uniref:Uncharacterized protein n=1 Tax=Aldrovandia affinis TaxID=143900 RepID=A0AAD7WEK6_9TELE|nr:hypothetical protein AAFF_G00056650 [Aldrovandia affinis]